MHRFLKNIFLFSCIIVLLLAAGEAVVRKLPTSYSYKAGWVRDNAARVSTLILGSSHTYYGVKPDILGDSCFNLANISQTPEYDLALLQQYLPSMINLKRIILPISYFTYRDPRLEQLSPGLCVNYKVGMHLPLHSDLSRYNFVISDFKAYTGRLRGLVLKQEQNECDSLGFGLGFDLSTRRKSWQQDAARRVAELTQTIPGRAEDAQRTLCRIIELCRRNNIECVLLTTPVWKTFIAEADSAQQAEMVRLSGKLVERYHLHYLDYYNSPLFVNEDFHDCDHLSDTGAVKLTGMIRDRLRL